MSDPQDTDSTIVVVGASLAGLRAAEEIRHEGHAGRVIVVGDEARAPYDRPPLSKQVLAGTWDVDRIHHHAPDKLDSLGLEFRLGLRAVSLDAGAQTLLLGDGEQLSYDGLIVATGTWARPLPGTETTPRVHTLRTLDNCLAIRADLASAGPAARVVVIGAGFIGSEVASTCHGLGARVTVVEAMPTPLSGVLGAQMGEVCAQLHRDHGVTVLTGVGVAGVSSDPGGAAPLAVHLTDETGLAADLVVGRGPVDPHQHRRAPAGRALDQRRRGRCRRRPQPAGRNGGRRALRPGPVLLVRPVPDQDSGHRAARCRR
jgi:NADPH-dependent 2,4-dienoyl-CoA reductase/sulfur reductase-like enzyme